MPVGRSPGQGPDPVDHPGAAGPPTSCTVKPGTPVFFFTLGGECSSVEDPPFSERTRRSSGRAPSRSCAKHSSTPPGSASTGGPGDLACPASWPSPGRAPSTFPPQTSWVFPTGRRPSSRGVLGAASAAAAGEPHDHRHDRWATTVRGCQPGGRQRRSGPKELGQRLGRRGRGRAVRATPSPGVRDGRLALRREALRKPRRSLLTFSGRSWWTEWPRALKRRTRERSRDEASLG